MTNVIKLIQHRITPLEGEKDNVNILRTFHRDDYKSLDVIIELLKCGEKYKLMLEELESGIIWHSTELENSVKRTINALKQKYFPKEENNNVN